MERETEKKESEKESDWIETMNAVKEGRNFFTWSDRERERDGGRGRDLRDGRYRRHRRNVRPTMSHRCLRRAQKAAVVEFQKQDNTFFERSAVNQIF